MNTHIHRHTHTHSGWRLHWGTLEGNIWWPEAVSQWLRHESLPSGLPVKTQTNSLPPLQGSAQENSFSVKCWQWTFYIERCWFNIQLNGCKLLNVGTTNIPQQAILIMYRSNETELWRSWSCFQRQCQCDSHKSLILARSHIVNQHRCQDVMCRAKK